MIDALIGYAIGTVQVVLLGWFQNRTAHRSHLRLLRAELRRLSYLTAKFGWRTDGPGSDTHPVVPELTATFLQAVVATDFYLTDEHDDDNTQQGLLELVDITGALKHYSDAAIQTTLDSQEELGDTRLRLWHEAKDLADAYDQTLNRFQLQVRSALADIERRLKEISFWRQVNRPLGRLPKGRNPPSLPPPSFGSESK